MNIDAHDRCHKANTWQYTAILLNVCWSIYDAHSPCRKKAGKQLQTAFCSCMHILIISDMYRTKQPLYNFCDGCHTVWYGWWVSYCMIRWPLMGVILDDTGDLWWVSYWMIQVTSDGCHTGWYRWPLMGVILDDTGDGCHTGWYRWPLMGVILDDTGDGCHTVC